MGGFVMKMMFARRRFEKAVEDEGYRPKFLSKIWKPKYVAGISYVKEQAVNNGSLGTMYTHLYPDSQEGRSGYPAGIIVFPLSFDSRCHECLDDFYSTLKDHEFYHAMEAYNCPRRLDIDYWDTIIKSPEELERRKTINRHAGEVRARLNQIQRFKQRKCSEKHMKKVRIKIELNLDTLIDLGVTDLAELIHPFSQEDFS
jgi:hypothetical protein